jgi:hypothetical protein
LGDKKTILAQDWIHGQRLTAIHSSTFINTHSFKPMKNLFVALFVAFMGTVASAQTAEFKSLEIDYGKITKGANGVREFSFKNTGSAPLEIKSAQGSCGCTVPTYPKEPIMPGQANVIQAKYDTQRVGEFTKYITIETNDPKNTSIRLTIKGTVVEEGEAVPTKKPALAPAH